VLNVRNTIKADVDAVQTWKIRPSGEYVLADRS